MQFGYIKLQPKISIHFEMICDAGLFNGTTMWESKFYIFMNYRSVNLVSSELFPAG